MKHYLSLVKFSHTLFAMPFAMIGFFYAVRSTGAGFEWMLLVKVVLCMVFARSAAMGFNRYIDREFDEQNPRTAIREIPAGVITPTNALLFVLINAGLFILITKFINPLCFYLSPVALLVVLGYSYTKRFTALCHIVLGLGLSLAPVGAYLAVTGAFALLPILFGLAVLFWVSGFDIIYALQDEEFDVEHHLHSIPVWLGKRGALVLSVLLHIVSAGLIIAAGVLASLDILYWVGVLVFCGLLIYQHLLVKPHDLSKVTLAFATTNGIASVIFAVFVVLSLYF